ncbi:MAG: hypothetical protein FJW99_03705 [Actinobacteria bacterium]|nr:hypothetical protein [Actinomycetota bacterium]
MIDLALGALRSAAGLGVAGNFAGHLEQAGEAADFANVVPTTTEAPKGIFPWYVPGRDGQLGVFPVTHDLLVLPDQPGVDLQIEPEVGLIARLGYDARGRVEAIVPEAVAAWNDCSIRREGARKISDKKNWGPASKGVAARGFAVRDIDPAGGLAGLRIASFVRRGGEAHEYGVDSPAASYSYAGSTLIDWMIDRLREQEGSDDTPLEPVGDYLAAAGYPGSTLIGIGATRYTPFGESTYLVAGDESIVVVYDERASSPARVRDAVLAGEEDSLDRASLLVQRVEVSGRP